MENGLRKLWADGGKAVNAWCGIPSAVATENMAQAGWDSMTVDMQHGLVDYQAMVGMLLPGIRISSADAADALAVAICHAHHRQTQAAFARPVAGTAAIGGGA